MSNRTWMRLVLAVSATFMFAKLVFDMIKAGRS
jgi:hypothetical protein